MTSFNPDLSGFRLIYHDTYRNQISTCDPQPPLAYRGCNEHNGGRRSSAEPRNRPSSMLSSGSQAPGAISPEPQHHLTGQSRKDRPKHDAYDDDDDDDDEGGQDDKKSSKRQETSYPGQSFACPFAKNDPVTHRSCLRYVMRRIGDVKSHIQRHHLRPIHCPTCGVVFGGPRKDEDRRKHIRAETCVLVDFAAPPGLSLDAMDRLRHCGEASRTGSRYERRWYGLWDSLYPGSPAPSTPYAGSEFQERMDLAAQDIINNYHVHEFANRFPVDRHEEINNFFNTLIHQFRSYAARQEDARETKMSSHLTLQPPMEQPSRQPTEQTDNMHDSYRGQAAEQVEDHSIWNPLRPDVSDGQDESLTQPAGESLAPGFPSRQLSPMSLGMFENSSLNDINGRGFAPFSNGYIDYRYIHRGYYYE